MAQAGCGTRPVPGMRKVCGPVEQPVTLISIRGLTKFYRMGDSVVHALDNVDLDIEKGERIIPEEALIHSQTFQEKLQELPQFADTLLPRIMRTALHRLHSTRSIQDVSQAVRELAESEGDRLDSDLSLVRYIAWAIPSVGFIGTVRGIGEALAKADQAIKGDVSGVTSSLGLAFNSTFVALFLSIILMFFIHMLQNRQESLVLEVEEYCREKLVAVMKIPFSEQSEISTL